MNRLRLRPYGREGPWQACGRIRARKPQRSTASTPGLRAGEFEAITKALTVLESTVSEKAPAAPGDLIAGFNVLMSTNSG